MSINLPVGSNYISDKLIGPALAIDTARLLYHLEEMYTTGARLPTHQLHIVYTLAGMGLVVGDYFAVRRYVDKQLESDFVNNKGSKTSSEADGVFITSILFIYTPLLFKAVLQYRNDLPLRDKIVDLVADLSVFGLILSRQIITNQMITNTALCNSSSDKAEGCPAPRVMNAWSNSLGN